MVEKHATTTADLYAIATSSAEKYGLTKKETTRMLAVINCESLWNVNSKGDYINGKPTSFGLAQFHNPAKWGLTVKESYDPYIALDLMSSVWKERYSEWSCYSLLFSTPL
jgi:hypothetical protein